MEGFFICISSIKKELVEKVYGIICLNSPTKELVEKVSGDDRNYRLDIMGLFLYIIISVKS